MSGIAGAIDFSGRAIPPALIARLTEAVAARGPDGEGCWTNGSVALGHRSFVTTLEAANERQPLRDEQRDLCLTLDGRIDNRDELIRELWTEPKGLTVTDGAIVIEAYVRWADKTPEHLLGDFAFALWDGRRRQLLCARDVVGIRPFFYASAGGMFVFGSEIAQVLKHPRLAIAPNEGMLAELLSARPASLEDTLYRNVFRLPPAHSMVVADAEIRPKAFFEFDPGKRIDYSHDEDYVDHLRDLLKEAVRCRLRSSSPVGVALSGGVDSSLVLAIASAHRGPTPVQAFHATFRDPRVDERAQAEAVARFIGVEARFIPCGLAPGRSLEAQVRQLRDLPDLPNGLSGESLYAGARREGCSVLLAGFGADDWLGGNPAHCADMLRALRIPSFVRQVRDDVAVYRRAGYGGPGAMRVFRWSVAPLVPRFARRLVRRLTRPIPAWISPAFARRISLAERLDRRRPAPRFPTYSQEQSFQHFISGWRVLEYEGINRIETRAPVEGRYPFEDRRVLEFAFALPERMRWSGRETKVALRRAASGLVPESVRTRTTTGDGTPFFLQTFDHEGGARAFATLQLVKHGFLDGGVVAAMYQRLGAGDAEAVYPLWLILALEKWYGVLLEGAWD